MFSDFKLLCICFYVPSFAILYIHHVDLSALCVVHFCVLSSAVRYVYRVYYTMSCLTSLGPTTLGKIFLLNRDREMITIISNTT